MRDVVLMPRAERQLRALYRYLAGRFYPENAARFLARLRTTCESLATGSERGTMQPELGHDVRVMGFERRVSIYFRVTEDRVIILAISFRGQIPGKL